jgi:hypothetical protein
MPVNGNLISLNAPIACEWQLDQSIDHPRNIPGKFGSNWLSGFGEEA